MIVMKFGEESLKNGQSIIHIPNIVKKFEDKTVLIIISAMLNVKDLLISILKKCQSGELKKAEKEIENLYKIHKRALIELNLNPNNYRFAYRDLEGLFERLFVFLCKESKFSPVSSDFVVSFGERFSGLLVDAALSNVGIKTSQVDGSQIIVASSDYGNARAFTGITQTKAREILLPLVKDKVVPIITGAFGLNRKGEVVTLGNKGLDRTASIIAKTFDAKEIVFWKEINGVFSNDPELDANTQFYSEVSYK